MSEEFDRDVADQLANLCAITERECLRLLDELIGEVRVSDPSDPCRPGEVADLAMEYAQRRSELAKYRLLAMRERPKLGLAK